MAVVSLHGTTAAELLQSRLDELDIIDSLLVAWFDKDGTAHVGWTDVTPQDLALLVMAVNRNVELWVFEEEEE